MFIDYFYVLLYVRYLQISLRLVVVTIVVIVERNVQLISLAIFFQESIYVGSIVRSLWCYITIVLHMLKEKSYFLVSLYKWYNTLKKEKCVDDIERCKCKLLCLFIQHISPKWC